MKNQLIIFMIIMIIGLCTGSKLVYQDMTLNPTHKICVMNNGVLIDCFNETIDLSSATQSNTVILVVKSSASDMIQSPNLVLQLMSYVFIGLVAVVIIIIFIVGFLLLLKRIL